MKKSSVVFHRNSAFSDKTYEIFDLRPTLRMHAPLLTICLMHRHVFTTSAFFTFQRTGFTTARALTAAKHGGSHVQRGRREHLRRAAARNENFAALVRQCPHAFISADTHKIYSLTSIFYDFRVHCGRDAAV
jgi:hypothetical protein